MKFQEIVFPLDKDYRAFESVLGELPALRAEVEILRSVFMELGPEQRDRVKKLEAIARKGHVKK